MSLKKSMSQISHGHTHDLNESEETESFVTDSSSESDNGESPQKVAHQLYNKILDAKLP